MEFDKDPRFSPKAQSDGTDLDSNPLLAPASFDKGMLIWMLLHRGAYFWMRAIFQIIAFSFLIITLLMMIKFNEGAYWHKTLAILVAKHCMNMMSYTIDLIAFASRKMSLLKYKFLLDAIIVVLIITIQIKFFTSDASHDISHEAWQIRRWVSMEIALFYTGMLV